MAMRRDAGAALLAVGAAILERFAADAGPDTVWNIGKVAFEPGAANVVPSAASLLLEFRDTAPATLDRLARAVDEIVAAESARRPVDLAVTETADIAPVDMDPALGDIIADAARRHGEDPMIMPSGAGHDAMVMARHLPGAMLFVPSIGGRSHDTAEDTTPEDIVLGCRVLASAVAAVLGR